jgi:hypothetical protein
MIKKSFPIKKPFYYDTKEGIDHFTKILVEENPKKLSEKEKEDIYKVGRDMKRSVLEYHSKKLKKFDNLDPTTYPSDPAQRGTLLEIGKLEKDLEVPPGQKKPRRNIWDEFVKNKGVMPELTAEERIRAKGPSDWDIIYGSMSPMEKGQWNAEKRKEKLQKQKEEAEEKKQKRIDNHTKQQWGIPDKKLADLPIIRGNIKYQKMHNQDLKSKMRGWISEADKEKKQEVKKPESTPEKPVEHFVLPSQRVTHVSPEDNQSLNQRLRNTKVTPGLSVELVKLQKDIDRNIKYVLGADQKDNLESRMKEATNKEELK